MQDHDLRDTLNNEILGRPGLPLSPPVRLTHVVVTFTPSHSPDMLLQDLASVLDFVPPATGTRHYGIATPQGFFQFERHGEFCQLTLAMPEPPAQNLSDDAWVNAVSGQRLVAIHSQILPKSAKPTVTFITDYFGHDDVAAARVAQGEATVWTDFRIDHTGYTRILIQNHGLTPVVLGRVTRSLHEIESYRMMALLTFPLAQALQPELARLETELAEIVQNMVAGDTVEGDAELLQRLGFLARDAEDMSIRTGFRFAAARAYAALVTKRLAQLDEGSLAGYQAISLFLDRRFSPAMATCEAVAMRISALTQRTERAVTLLRTRVDIALEKQNHKLLRSMETRSHQQLLLQETVEGISVVAISYYLFHMVSVFSDGAVEHFFGEHVKIPEWLLVPVVILFVWWMIHARRSRIKKKPLDSI